MSTKFLGGRSSHWMKAIGIFFRRHFKQDSLFVNLFRQRKLDKYAVDLRAVIEAVDQAAEFVGRNIGRGGDGFVVNPEIAGSFRFAAHIDLGCRIAAGEDDGKSGSPSRMGHDAIHAGTALRLNLVADAITV